jgi:uncharacterized damage-inducible protein DinB
MSDPLREHLLKLLDGGDAHATFDDAIEGITPKLRGVQPPAVPYSAWQLLEHLRIAQWDILEFSRDSKHISPKWPDAYWPKEAAPPDAAAWDRSVDAFHAHLAAMKELVSDPQRDLFAPFPHGSGQTLLREALLVADHNSYHLGQLVLLRRLLGAWKDE